MKGAFISFEGIEGSGKSTQAKLLYSYLEGRGHEVVLTEEPGGTVIGKEIREVLLAVEHRNMSPLTELLLYMASRAQHVQEVILPALDRGAIVITDRFADSTIAYQGYGRGIDFGIIDTLDAVATGRLRPDLTILLDIDIGTGLQRNKDVRKVDRLELEDISFHERVRDGYHAIASREPSRVRTLSVRNGIEETHRAIVEIVRTRLGLS